MVVYTYPVSACKYIIHADTGFHLGESPNFLNELRPEYRCVYVYTLQIIYSMSANFRLPMSKVLSIYKL